MRRKNLVIQFVLGLFLIGSFFSGVFLQTDSVHAQTFKDINNQHIAAAIEFTPEVKFPGFDGTKEVNNNFIAEYIKAIFVYFIWTVGILAMAMVIYGGVKWTAAAGNPGQINDARETINNAIIGLIIALTSVLLLNVINPNFTKLGLPEISTVQRSYFDGAAAVEICPAEVRIGCGLLHKLDFQVRDRNGASVDAFCMGTSCSEYASHVCALDKQDLSPPVQIVGGAGDFTEYIRSGGCVSSVTVKQPSPGEYAKYSSFKASAYSTSFDFNPFDDDRRQCGLIEAGREFEGQGVVGSACKEHTNWETCYYYRSIAEVIDAPGTNNDKIRHMSCPYRL